MTYNTIVNKWKNRIFSSRYGKNGTRIVIDNGPIHTMINGPYMGRSKSSEIWDLFASNSARHYHNSVPADPLRLYGCYGTVIGFYFEISSRRSVSFPFVVLRGDDPAKGEKDDSQSVYFIRHSGAYLWGLRPRKNDRKNGLMAKYFQIILISYTKLC